MMYNTAKPMSVDSVAMAEGPGREPSEFARLVEENHDVQEGILHRITQLEAALAIVLAPTPPQTESERPLQSVHACELHDIMANQLSTNRAVLYRLGALLDRVRI